MRKQEVLDKVHTRTYYIAESKKGEIPNLAFSQTSSDNNDILTDYLDSLVQRLTGYMTKRLLQVEWDGETLKVTTNRDNADEMAQALDKAITDYMVEELVARWMEDTFPKMADRRLAEERLDYVKDCVCALAPNVRRRATNLGV